MLCGIHNHELALKLASHLLAGRLNEEEKKRVIDMTKSFAVPGNILTNLKEKNKDSVTTIKQVYNERIRWCKGIRGDKTEMQYVISKLEEHKYVYFTIANGEKPLLKTYFMLVRNRLICLTFFQPFWSWAPLTKQYLSNAII